MLTTLNRFLDGVEILFLVLVALAVSITFIRWAGWLSAPEYAVLEVAVNMAWVVVGLPVQFRLKWREARKARRNQIETC